MNECLKELRYDRPLRGALARLSGPRAISRSRKADGGWQRRAQGILSAGFLPEVLNDSSKGWCKVSLARPVLFITLWPSWPTVHFYSVGLVLWQRFGRDLPSPFWRPKECQGATASCVGERAGYVSKLQTDGPPDIALCSSHPVHG